MAAKLLLDKIGKSKHIKWLGSQKHSLVAGNNLQSGEHEFPHGFRQIFKEVRHVLSWCLPLSAPAPTNCVNCWLLSVNFVEVVEVSEIQGPKIWCFYQAGTYLLDPPENRAVILMHLLHVPCCAGQVSPALAGLAAIAGLSSAQLSSAELSSAQPAPCLQWQKDLGVLHTWVILMYLRGSGGMRWQWWYILTERGVAKQELWYKATANQDSLFLVKIFQFFLSSAYFFSLIYNLILST